MNACGMDPARERLAHNDWIPEPVTAIMREVELAYKIPDGTLRKMADQPRSRSRNTRVTTARKVAIWLVRQSTGFSSPKIGRMFGAMHHTSVLYSCNRVDAEPMLQRSAERIAARVALRRAG